MATPLYKFLKNQGYTTYVVPGASEDISASHQNENYHMNFSKFMLLNLDLSKMDFTNPEQFNTESFNVITDMGDLLVNSLRNYVANQESVIRESKINNNTYFYDPNEIQTTSEKILWKERSVIKYNVSNIVDTGDLVPDPETLGNFLKVYEITIASSTTIKPSDTIILTSEGTFQISTSSSIHW